MKILTKVTKPSDGHEPCEQCNGMGFTRSGEFGDRRFPTCPQCKGLGQKYLAPE